MPLRCLKIIESMSLRVTSIKKTKMLKLKMSTRKTLSTQAVSSDVAELKDMVSGSILDRKNQNPSFAPLIADLETKVVLLVSPVQNPLANNQNIFIEEITSIKTEDNNFNQGSDYRPPVHRTVVNQRSSSRTLPPSDTGPKAVIHDTDGDNGNDASLLNIEMHARKTSQPPVDQIHVSQSNPDVQFALLFIPCS
ncbi:hypothetical protein Tco_0745000 [Tanacetum coccineum]